jgi:2-polyprenyl-6-methoxyphenol hydroxylase-like FAD-dependent oxidoreductase
MSDFQVIIIGGRPAGASLAIRLGWQNVKSLLVDRMTFPSLPGVPSGPILYSQHLEALKELGLSEDELFYPDGRIDVLDVSFVGYLRAAIPLNAAPAAHDYGYGADRMKFDTAIWDRACKQKSVTAHSGFAVTGILKENGRVTGIRGQADGGKEETITADLVVGADGRFSFAAGQFEAATLEEHNKHTTST